MKIDVYATMYNEELMLPYFLRHYEKIADRIFVWEDGSTDDTRRILESHPKVIIMPIEVSKIDDVYWVGHVWTRYKHISRGKADLVMIVDADEFIYHPDLMEVLEGVVKKGGQLIPCPGFLMIADQFPATDGQIYDEIKTGIPDAGYDKACIFDPKIYIRYSAGRHAIKKIQKDVVRCEDTGIKMLHYRFLGEGYFIHRSRRNMERMSVQNFRYHYYYPNEITTKRPHTLWWYRKMMNEARVVI